MKKNMLAILLDLKDPLLSEQAKVAALLFVGQGETVAKKAKTVAVGTTFVIVQEVLDTSGRPPTFPCTVIHNDGTTSVIPAGQLIPLLELSEEDAARLTPEEAFLESASEIVKRIAFEGLPLLQRDFFAELRNAE